MEAEISKVVVEARKTVLLKSTLGFKRSFRYLVVSTEDAFFWVHSIPLLDY